MLVFVLGPWYGITPSIWFVIPAPSLSLLRRLEAQPSVFGLPFGLGEVFDRRADKRFVDFGIGESINQDRITNLIVRRAARKYDASRLNRSRSYR